MNLVTEELEEVPCESPIPHRDGLHSEAAPVVVMELLDDHWFFRNCLCDTPPNKAKVAVLKFKCNPSDSVRQEDLGKKEKAGVANQGEVVAGRKIRKVLMTRSYDSVEKFVSSSRLNFRPPSGIDSRRRSNDLNYRRGKVMKTWKSMADLEHEEVRGFEDLGFVFDKDRLSPVLMKMIPGLSHEGSDCGEESDRKVATRPYLSERWMQRSTPSVVNWVGRKLAPDVKEQLQLWAKTVACNKHYLR